MSGVKKKFAAVLTVASFVIRIGAFASMITTRSASAAMKRYRSKRSGQNLNPTAFGQQPDGTYLPSPEEIERECSLIKARWSGAEESRRLQETTDVVEGGLSAAAS
jgi:hypothetical protein